MGHHICVSVTPVYYELDTGKLDIKVIFIEEILSEIGLNKGSVNFLFCSVYIHIFSIVCHSEMCVIIVCHSEMRIISLCH